jgi:hypothetical protein
MSLSNVMRAMAERNGHPANVSRDVTVITHRLVPAMILICNGMIIRTECLPTPPKNPAVGISDIGTVARTGRVFWDEK